MESLIDIVHLSYHVGHLTILNDCNLQVRNGEIVCIIGPNGSGKTTLLNCILGFYTVSCNSVFLNGTDIKKLHRNQIAKRISYVQQVSQNESSLKVCDYLSLGRIAHKRIYQGLNHEDEMLIERIVSETGITHLLHKSLLHLSGGEKQLVMISRALVQDTDIIIMDEPASALDFGNQAVLMRLIKTLNSMHKTIIFTTHNPNHALALKSNVCILNKGKIARVGRYDECISSEVLQEVYGDGVKFISENECVVCTFNIS